MCVKFSPPFFFLFWKSLSLLWLLPSRINWSVSSKIHLFLLPSTGFTSMHAHTCLSLCGFWGSELSSSCLQGKCPTANNLPSPEDHISFTLSNCSVSVTSPQVLQRYRQKWRQRIMGCDSKKLQRTFRLWMRGLIANRERRLKGDSG